MEHPRIKTLLSFIGMESAHFKDVRLFSGWRVPTIIWAGTYGPGMTRERGLRSKRGSVGKGRFFGFLAFAVRNRKTLNPSLPLNTSLNSSTVMARKQIKKRFLPRTSLMLGPSAGFSN